MRLTPCHHTTMKPLLRFTKARRATNLATPAVPPESLLSLHPEPRGQITGFMERLRSGKKRSSGRDPGTSSPPHTPTPESQPGITDIRTDPSGQLDSQPPADNLPVADREASNRKESVVNIIVDNLAQAAEICEKIANVVDKAPLIAPLAALVSTILKTCKEIKDTYEHRNNLFRRIERIALDLHGTIMRMETTQYSDDSTGRLKADIEEYVGLFKKASALLSDFDTQGKLKTSVNHKDWESKLAALDRELDSFAGQFNTKRGTDLQIGQSAIRKKVDEVQVLALGKKLQEWLQSPPDMGLKHHATQQLHHEGTGTWFLDGPQFTEWRKTSGSYGLKENNRTTSPLHLLFTSQSRTDFTAAFKGLPHILLEPATTRDDIIGFVDSELRSPKLKHWEHHITKITAVVVDKSNGMFRLAACLLIELSRRKFDRNPDIILARLPGELFEIYARFLEGFEEGFYAGSFFPPDR
ncbi:hypothetical protein B0H17DRAFT_1187473 [Mycena rosella]|uniref:Fungal N-terminal domain-containing protein n=1 Tax=Mycena rosella TaxID=1033263 RepID=A0AAD7C0J4_MYCRO|nr:hypothetical protein B0H17DRAFT_1187473 [Mycena rosella]